MSDYISREAAVKIAQKYGLANGSALGRRTGLADCIAIEIEGVPAANVEPVRHGRWIPCNERMPNPGERVLATDGGFVGEMYIGKRGEWRRYNVTYIQDLMALDILWWMPMPEPPEEK